MDTPETASSALDTSQAAAEIMRVLEPQAVKEHNDETAQPEAEKPQQEAQDKPAEETPKNEEAPDSDETITIEVDGKSVEIKKSELPDLYKGQLRQADYTKKTMEVAEQRKAAEAEATKAREERTKYAQMLTQAEALLTAQLQEQSQVDWDKLLANDPVEYLQQQHLAQTRQARLQQVFQERQQIEAQQQAEQMESARAFVAQQREELLAKLPEWKDEAKAKAESTQIKDYLRNQGFDDSALERISDHRAVLLARKAMLYDQMISKAQVTAKKVSQLPQKVERPGVGQVAPLDGRTRAMQKLAKSGSLDDAAAVFASIL